MYLGLILRLNYLCAALPNGAMKSVIFIATNSLSLSFSVCLPRALGKIIRAVQAHFRDFTNVWDIRNHEFVKCENGSREELMAQVSCQRSCDY